MVSTNRSQEREGAYGVRAVERALDVLDALADAPNGHSLAELARAARLPKSSIFRYLVTLEARGYVERTDDRSRFRLGRRLLAVRSLRLEVLARAARPHLAAVRDRFQETVNLGVLDGTRVAYLEILESPRSMRLAARQGDRDPIHSTALGKAIASQLSRDEVLRILDAEGMAKLTLRTIDDREAYFHVLDEVRRGGFALDNGENEEGGRCVAVPLSLDSLQAAISLSAPAFRFSLDHVEPVAAALVRAARTVSDELAHGDA